MNQILLMQNQIQPYAWGSHTAIAELMGEQGPTEQPQAELWMGAHPKSPSQVWLQETWQPLDRVIARHPLGMLGDKVAAGFGRQLPFLFKVLAAGQPLSIQAHPDKSQARHGFKRENRTGIPLNAYNRNYKDDQHKPECICALTPFWGMCGFRTTEVAYNLIEPVWPLQESNWSEPLDKIRRATSLQGFFTFLMNLDDNARMALIDHVVRRVTRKKGQDIAYDWVLRLNERYPHDIGVLSPLMLNMIQLQPGQALFLPARQLHAYLEGLGIELMANSDNVLRGGLTPKHVDVPELLAILDFEPFDVQILLPQGADSSEKKYPGRAQEFALSVLDASDTAAMQCINKIPGPEILFCIHGEAVFSWPQMDGEMVVRRGQSVFVPSGVKEYTLKGSAKFYKASVNI